MKLALLANSSLALPSLHALLQQGLVAGVGVPASREEGAERVAALAEAAGVPLWRFTREGLEGQLLAWLAELAPQAVVVFTFPWRIPGPALAALPRGWFNVHFAPLPEYRGPEPLFWLLREGAKAGAVVIHRMTAALDRGPIVFQRAVPIGPRDTHGLHQANLAAAAVAPTRQLVAGLLAGHQLPETPQDESRARYWPRPTLPDLCIDWHAPAAEISRLIRAANPWNRGAFAQLRGQPLRILAATPVPRPVSAPALVLPGAVIQADTKTGLILACGQGESIRADILALDEGYFTGSQLIDLGVGVGAVFGTVATPQPVGG